MLARARKPPGAIQAAAAAPLPMSLSDGVSRGRPHDPPRPPRARRPPRAAHGRRLVSAEEVKVLARACTPPDAIQAAP